MTQTKCDALIAGLRLQAGLWANVGDGKAGDVFTTTADMLEAQALRRVELEAEVEHKSLVIAAWRDKHDTLRAELDALKLVTEGFVDAKVALTAELDALQGEVARLKRVLINVHNNGANWSGQSIIREAMETSNARPVAPAKPPSSISHWLESGAPESFKSVTERDMQIALSYFDAPAKPAQPLTEAEIQAIYSRIYLSGSTGKAEDFARAIEAAHGIKGQA